MGKGNLQAISEQLDLICEALDEIDETYFLSLAQFSAIDDPVDNIRKIIERMATCRPK